MLNLFSITSNGRTYSCGMAIVAGESANVFSDITKYQNIPTENLISLTINSALSNPLITGNLTITARNDFNLIKILNHPFAYLRVSLNLMKSSSSLPDAALPYISEFFLITSVVVDNLSNDPNNKQNRYTLSFISANYWNFTKRMVYSTKSQSINPYEIIRGVLAESSLPVTTSPMSFSPAQGLIYSSSQNDNALSIIDYILKKTYQSIPFPEYIFSLYYSLSDRLINFWDSSTILSVKNMNSIMDVDTINTSSNTIINMSASDGQPPPKIITGNLVDKLSVINTVATDEYLFYNYDLNQIQPLQYDHMRKINTLAPEERLKALNDQISDLYGKTYISPVSGSLESNSFINYYGSAGSLPDSYHNLMELLFFTNRIKLLKADLKLTRNPGDIINLLNSSESVMVDDSARSAQTIYNGRWLLMGLSLVVTPTTVYQDLELARNYNLS